MTSLPVSWWTLLASLPRTHSHSHPTLLLAFSLHPFSFSFTAALITLFPSLLFPLKSFMICLLSPIVHRQTDP